MGKMGRGIHRAADLFSILRLLATLPENQLALRVRTCFPGGAPLRGQGSPKKSPMSSDKSPSSSSLRWKGMDSSFYLPLSVKGTGPEGMPGGGKR